VHCTFSLSGAKQTSGGCGFDVGSAGPNDVDQPADENKRQEKLDGEANAGSHQNTDQADVQCGDHQPVPMPARERDHRRQKDSGAELKVLPPSRSCAKPPRFDRGRQFCRYLSVQKFPRDTWVNGPRQKAQSPDQAHKISAVALETNEVPSSARPPLPACGCAELHAFRAGDCSFRSPDQS
jgi:hypothetical protein